MEKITQDKMWVVYLSTFPPRECGIATFTADLVENFDQLYFPREESKVVALNVEGSDKLSYPSKVLFEISENESEEYVNVAQKLNEMSQVKLISIQHEYGIFGKDQGKNVLVFLNEIQKPVAITFHTVLPNPGDDMKEVTKHIVEKVDRIIVMTQISKDLLKTIYGVADEKIKVIPHGIHPFPYTDGTKAKESLQLSGKRVLSTFGLLSRGKGVEFAIQSLPEIIKEFPNTVYLIIGATHPVVARREGEVYRNELIDLAKKLHVEEHVIFYNRYLKTEELLNFLQATDIYLSLSQNPDQAVSGTFTYALGAGRPVISTSFMQAKEVITPDLGSLVGFAESDEIKNQVITLFRDPGRLHNMGKTAYFRTRGMIWPNVALMYMNEFISLSAELGKKEKNLPPINLQHLKKLTDDFGMLQFANLDEPDLAWGYTLDDNARALVAVSWYNTIQDDPELLRLAHIYLGILEKVSKETGGFENYITSAKNSDYSRNSSENLEDSNARGMWALSEMAISTFPDNIKERAQALLLKQWSFHKRSASPRAAAFYIKSLALRYAKEHDEQLKEWITTYANFLFDIYRDNAHADWQWFEDSLTYSNAVLSEALLIAYKVTGNENYFKAGKVTLDFLISQSFDGDLCVPIGQAGWFKRGGKKELYDQQPEEVSALVLALHTMIKVCGENDGKEEYKQKIKDSFNWFLGNNIKNQVVYSHITGGCYDGVGEKEINLNQGAESTLSYLLARLVMEDK